MVRWPDSVNGSVQVLLQWHEMPSSREDARLFRDGQGKVRWVGQRGRVPEGSWKEAGKKLVGSCG